MGNIINAASVSGGAVEILCRDILKKHWVCLAVSLVLALTSALLPVNATAAMLEEALDSTNLPWVTGGAGTWGGQTTITHDGVDAAQAAVGVVGTNAFARIGTTVSGPGTLTFWWKVSCQNSNGGLYFSANGQFYVISGEVDWQQRTVVIPPGIQTLTWNFQTFGAGTADRGWLDQVSYVPAPPIAPVITNQPQSQTVAPGDFVNLTVGVSGRPLNYQWRLNGTDLSGATGSSLSLSNMQLADAGSYSVVVSNSVGTATSSNAVLTVNPTPSINAQPHSFAVYAGATAAFSVSAKGTQPLYYQWKKNGTNIVTATSSSYMISNVQSNDTGIYSVVVSNAFGSVSSSNAVLTVLPPGSCLPVPSDIVSWWRAESDALDEVGGNHGTIVGNATFGSGRVGQGFAFDGIGDGINVGNPTTLRLQNFTIESWIKRAHPSRATQGPQASGAIFHGPDGAYGLGLNDDGRIYLTKVGVGGIFSTAAITDTNSFHHVAVTKSESNVVLYVDGVAESVGPYDPGFVFNGTMAVGARGGDYGTSFFGLIDELAIYNRALSTNEIQSIYNAGSGGKCPFSSAPHIISQPLSQTVQVGPKVTFTVVADGSAPLYYAWHFNGTAISGETNSSLTLNGVKRSDSGSYSVLVSNAVGSVMSSNAILTVTLPPTAVGVGVTNSPANGQLKVPVEMVANGSENALRFSVTFDPAILICSAVSSGEEASGAALVADTTQVGSGRIGLGLAQPLGATFRTGAVQLAEITFEVAAMTNSASTTLSFSNQPTPCEVYDPNAVSLPVDFTGTTISIPPADFESDVALPTASSRAVTVTDWAQIGRFIAQLDTPAAGSQFQRADSTPRATRGDASLDITDWVQAGRYAAGLDPLTPVGGPATQGSSFVRTSKTGPKGAASGCTVLVSDGTLRAGETNAISVRLDSLGDENALGFTLIFDPAILTFISVTLGSNAAGATLYLNGSQSTSGKVGVALALPAGNTFSAGLRELVKVSFAVSEAASGTTSVSFVSQPVGMDLSDPLANHLSASYVDGSLTIEPPPPPKLSIYYAGTNVFLSWRLSASNFVLQANDGAAAITGVWTNLSVTPQTGEGVNTVILPVETFAKHYRLIGP